MTPLAKALLGAIGTVALSCTVSRQGTLETLPTGPVIPVTVSVEGDAVAVRGRNPATGETFEGRLAKVVRGRAGSGSWYPSSGGGVTPMPGGISAAGTGGNETTIDVAGNLEGDQGTTLRCVAQVERRLRLRGGGTCAVEGDAVSTTSYRLRF
jgi:hypothetical protein